MISLRVGTQRINGVPHKPSESSQTSTDIKVSFVGKALNARAYLNQPRPNRNHSFSPLRFLWWASLLIGARAQQTTPFPASIELANLTDVDGFVLNGEQSNDHSGNWVASAGDVNNDGITDLAIGAYNATANGASSAGKSYVVFGRTGLGSTGSLELSGLAGINGFVLNGEEVGDNSGSSIASVGDLNDDGIVDLVIGAYTASPNGILNAGKSYVVFGRAGLGSSGNLELSSLNGTNGFVLNGKQVGDVSGYSVANAGDVNGDGVADLVIGAANASKSYVVFGRVGIGSSGSLELSSLNGSNGFVLNCEVPGDLCGVSVASAGDVNDDRIADFVIGAYNASISGKAQSGKSYVVFGRVGLGIKGSLDLSSLNGTNGFFLYGEAAGDRSGVSVASAGDVNGDRITDLIIGTYGASPIGKSAAGKSYVVFGRAGLGSSGSLELSSLNGTNGFVLNGEIAGGYSGASVASAGDINGDRISDLVIGAFLATSGGKKQAGKSYVVFGRVGLGSNGSIELSTLNGTSGFVLNGQEALDYSGVRVASAGDVNGDGVADIVIGASGAPSSGKPSGGKSYVIFGRKLTAAAVLNTTMPSLTPQLTPSTSSQSVATGQSSLTSSSTTSLPINSNPSGGSLPLIIGLSAAVAALACSLLGVGLYYVKRKRDSQISAEPRTGLKGNGELTTGYTSIEAIHQGMASVRAENQYNGLPLGLPNGHYSDPPPEPQQNNEEHYDEVRLAQLNAEMDQYSAS